jgi:hypothetical protein
MLLVVRQAEVELHLQTLSLMIMYVSVGCAKAPLDHFSIDAVHDTPLGDEP